MLMFRKSTINEAVHGRLAKTKGGQDSNSSVCGPTASQAFPAPGRGVKRTHNKKNEGKKKKKKYKKSGESKG